LKKDFIEINTLDTLNKVKIYEYKLKDSETSHIGVIADELEKIVPSVVTLAKSLKKDLDPSDLSIVDQVNYTGLVPMLIRSVQELSAKVDNLTLRLNTLENEIA